MKFKDYFSLLFHVVVTAAIVLSFPIITCIIFYSILPKWGTLVLSLLSAVPTIYWGIKYMFRIVDKFDFFKGV